MKLYRFIGILGFLVVMVGFISIYDVFWQFNNRILSGFWAVGFSLIWISARLKKKS